MSDPRPDKVAAVTEVREKLDSAEAVLITEYRGLTVADLAQLRHSLRGGGGEYRVYKNTFVRRAAAELGLEIADQLTGPTALAFVGAGPAGAGTDGATPDVASVAKVLRDFAKDNPLLVVKGGILGDQILDAAGATALASLPTASEVYARLAGAIIDGARGIAGSVSGVHRSVAYALQAVIDSGHFGSGDAQPSSDDASPDAADAPANDATENDATETSADGGDENDAADPAAEMSTDDNTTADDAAQESE